MSAPLYHLLSVCNSCMAGLTLEKRPNVASRDFCGWMDFRKKTHQSSLSSPFQISAPHTLSFDCVIFSHRLSNRPHHLPMHHSTLPTIIFIIVFDVVVFLVCCIPLVSNTLTHLVVHNYNRYFFSNFTTPVQQSEALCAPFDLPSFTLIRYHCNFAPSIHIFRYKVFCSLQSSFHPRPFKYGQGCILSAPSMPHISLVMF